MSNQRIVLGSERQANDVSSMSTGEGVDKKVVQSPLDKLIDFLSNDWRREIEIYIDYYTRLWAEARKLERVGMTHNPQAGLYPNGKVGEIADSESLENRTQFYIPELDGGLEKYPAGTIFAWQDVSADWGWNIDEDPDFDQVAHARREMLEWQKTEKLRQRLLENQAELRAWLQSYRPETLPVQPVDWERNVITDMSAFFACSSKKSRAESKYLAELQARFGDEPVFLTETSFAKRIFEVIHRGN